MYLQTVKMSRSVCYRGSKWHFISLSHDAYLCIGKLFKGFLSTCRNKTLHSLLLCLHFVESLLKTCTVRCDQYWLRYRTNCALQLQEPPADWTKQSRLWRDCRRDRALIFPLLSCWFHSATNQHDIIFKLDFLLSRPTFIFPPLQAAKGGGGGGRNFACVEAMTRNRILWRSAFHVPYLNTDWGFDFPQSLQANARPLPQKKPQPLHRNS